MQLDIILITYNQAAFIEQALLGLFMQRLNSNVQARVIIADDASTDDTLAIIRQMEKQSPFPFYYLPSAANMGHVLNYRRAFQTCTGDYVAILEGDDWWCSPLHLQRHLDFLDLHRECVLSSSRPYLYDMRTQRFGFASFPDDKGDVWLITAQDEATGNKIANLSTCVLRNATLQQVILDERLWQVDMLDWLLELMLAEKGFLAKHKESTSVYRCQDAGLWSRLDKEGQKELILKQVEQYDTLFQGKYSVEFNQIRCLYNPPKPGFKHRLLRICPPIIQYFLKSLIPPVFLKKHRN